MSRLLEVPGPQRFPVVDGRLAWLAGAADKASPTPADQRQRLTKMATDGNFKDAYDGLRKLALDPADDPKQVGNDLNLAINCLHQLGRVDEVDPFREGVIEAHKKNWHLLQTAAHSYFQGEHYGYIVAGKFYRGEHRGGGRFVNTYPRDPRPRPSAPEQALPLVKDDKDRAAAAGFYLNFADLLLSAENQQMWRCRP